MKRSLLLTAVLLIFTTADSIAHTVKWAIEPIYNSIAIYNDSIYKVYSGSGVRLVNRQGKDLLSSAPVTADSITDFKNGYALLMRSESDKQRLVGILHPNLRVTVIDKEWYVDDYPFFSEGLLPVKDKKNKYGFISPNGKVVVKFEYAGVHPFKENRASVFKAKSGFGSLLDKAKEGVGIGNSNGNKVVYITQTGSQISLAAEIGDIYLGSTFRNGEALVQNKEGNYFVIDQNGNVKRIENSPILEFDDDFSIKSGYYPSNSPKNSNYNDGGITYFMENDLYGFKNNGNIIVPAQFAEVQPFHNGYALVRCANSKWGMIGLDKDEITLTKKTTPTNNSEEEAVDYIVNMPTTWNQKNLIFVCATDNKSSLNKYESMANGSNSRTISFVLPIGDRELSIVGDYGLLIWQYYDSKSNDIKKSQTNDSEVKISVYPGKAKANAKNNAFITVTIINESSEAQTMDVIITGKKLSGGKYNLTLSPGEKKNYRMTFSEVTEVEKRRITVKIGSKIVNRTIEVEPFIVF